MRPAPLLALALLALPLAAALAPLDVYVGADPIATVDAWQDPYASASTMACVAPMTLQVQRNAGGTWDLLARGAAAAPSPLAIAGDPGVAEPSATNCATFLAPTLSVTNLVGSPSTGLSKVLSSSTCYRESVSVSPFTVGGPATMYHSYSYARSCYGTGYFFAMRVAPTAMG